MFMREVNSRAEAHTVVEGHPMLMYSSNNYLGMANHPKVKKAAQRAIEAHGTGSCSARLMGGTFHLHSELEKRLGGLGRLLEAAALYSSGYVSNVATLSTLFSGDDMVFIDELVHASLIDGLRFAQIPFRAFLHNDIQDLDRKMSHSKVRGVRAVVVDGVYSMGRGIWPGCRESIKWRGVTMPS